MQENRELKTTPSLQGLILEKEIEALRFLAITLWIFFIIVPLEQVIERQIELDVPQLLTGWQAATIEIIIFLAAIYITLSIRFRKGVRLGEYMFLILFSLIPTLVLYWIGYLWLALAYLPIMMLSCFFYDWRLPLVVGTISFFSFFSTPVAPPFSMPRAYFLTGFFILATVVAILIIKRNYAFIKSLVEGTKELERAKQEVEESRASLEIKVRARTGELRELAESLDERVKQRTKDLQEKVEELERFHRLTIGRELKMINFKKEIEELKKELEKRKK